VTDLRAHALVQRAAELAAEQRALPRQCDPERELRAEVARLTAELEAVRAENARLMEALRWVTAPLPTTDYPWPKGDRADE
jgi:hypothetical protein